MAVNLTGEVKTRISDRPNGHEFVTELETPLRIGERVAEWREPSSEAGYWYYHLYSARQDEKDCYFLRGQWQSISPYWGTGWKEQILSPEEGQALIRGHA